MMITTYDLGYGLAIAFSRRHVLRIRFPFPLRWSSWRYLIKRWRRK